MDCLASLPFKEVWAVDFEFHAPDGERQRPICLVGVELKTGREVRRWLWDSHDSTPPFSTGPDSLFVAHYSSAEWRCFLALGWPVPANAFDTFTEFRNLSNGLPTPGGAGLLGALKSYGLQAMAAQEKDDLRGLAIRGGPFTAQEQEALLDYCAQDVLALVELFPRMLEDVESLEESLLRGRYMAALASVEWNGLPVDVGLWARLKASWTAVQLSLVEQIAGSFGVFSGLTIDQEAFGHLVQSRGIWWPTTATGKWEVNREAFQRMLCYHPALEPIYTAQERVGKMRLSDLAVGGDGRNRCLLSAFRARTGRNQPSSSKYLFGMSRWVRGLAQPVAGRVLIQADYSQQEIQIAAVLSGDQKLLAAVNSGDVYLAFGKDAGLIPADGTKESHPRERSLCKTTVLGTQYGMGKNTLAEKLQAPVSTAKELLRLHQDVYRDYWAWSQETCDFAFAEGELQTALGWTLHISPDAKATSVRNFPIQATGAEILRLATVLAVEEGLQVCALVHDALVVECSEETALEVEKSLVGVMTRAAQAILGEHPIKIDAQTIRPGERLLDEGDPRSGPFFSLVVETLEQIEQECC